MTPNNLFQAPQNKYKRQRPNFNKQVKRADRTVQFLAKLPAKVEGAVQRPISTFTKGLGKLASFAAKRSRRRNNRKRKQLRAIGKPTSVTQRMLNSNTGFVIPPPYASEPWKESENSMSQEFTFTIANLTFANASYSTQNPSDDFTGSEMFTWVYDLNPLYTHFSGVPEVAQTYTTFAFTSLDVTFIPGLPTGNTQGNAAFYFQPEATKPLPGSWDEISKAKKASTFTPAISSNFNVSFQELVTESGKIAWQCKPFMHARSEGTQWGENQIDIMSDAANKLQGTLVFTTEGLKTTGTTYSEDQVIGSLRVNVIIEFTGKTSISGASSSFISPNLNIDVTLAAGIPVVTGLASQYWRQGATNVRRFYYTGPPMRFDFDQTIHATTMPAYVVAFYTRSGTVIPNTSVFDEYGATIASDDKVQHTDGIIDLPRGAYIEIASITGKVTIALKALSAKVYTAFD